METCVRLETHAPYKARLARLIAKRSHVHSAKAICELFVAKCDAAGVDPKKLRAQLMESDMEFHG